MKKILIIGRQQSGKTTLIQALRNEPISYKKTQAMEYKDIFIDTPGEYLEMKRFNSALQISSYESDLIIFMQSCCDHDSTFHPCFAQLFNTKVIGVVSKIDLCPNGIQRAREFLQEAGASEIYEVSAFTGFGLETVHKIVF